MFKRRASGFFEPASLDATETDAVSYLVEGAEDAVLSVSADAIGAVRVSAVKDGAVRLASPKKIT